MAFQRPITIKNAVEFIRTNQYVLPAIQREFVWKPEQIIELFDSIMRGYPIGSFLYWNVEKKNCQKFKFYGFLTDYHQKENSHNPVENLTGVDGITAILDGQQRLTALNIGLRGSYARKSKYKRRTTSSAYPQKDMYLNLLNHFKGENSESKFDFKFLTEEEAQNQKEKFWFPVKEVLGFTKLSDINKYVRKNRLNINPFAKECLVNLFQVICKKPLIHCFLEDDQDIDKVLNIFIRANNGGTVLNRSDLLLSIATNQWKNYKARKVIHNLVDNLNKTGKEFTFNKDFVLKSCLVLADIPNVGFKVKNFTRENVEKIESEWKRISNSLQLTVELVSSFGYNGKSLTANNILIPIAYYLLRRNASEGYLDRSEYKVDHHKIQQWVARAILKAGTFGSGVDTTLNTIRKSIRSTSKRSFPINELDSAFDNMRKSLSFTEKEVENLMDQTYDSKLTFSVLTLLYPQFKYSYQIHIDHIFPKSRFTEQKLLVAGVPKDQIDEFIECSDKIANLQLLEPMQNQQKSNKMPLVWLQENKFFETNNTWKRRNYITGDLPDHISGFLKFYKRRRNKMKRSLTKFLVK